MLAVMDLLKRHISCMLGTEQSGLTTVMSSLGDAGYGPASDLFFKLNLKPFYFLGHCFDLLLFCMLCHVLPQRALH